ncbi:CAP domain-containing protein [Lactobacillus sp. XV13L]|nr:CAP domain-containing protein [Lactobacillus sp. XV13L]
MQKKHPWQLIIASLICTWGLIVTAHYTQAATYNYPVVSVTQTPYAYLYNNNGERIVDRLLLANSDWRVGSVRYVDGGSENFHHQLMYQVSTNEWLRGDQSRANFDPQTGQLITAADNHDHTALIEAMLQELNRLRVQNDLAPLKMNAELNMFSQQRAAHLQQQGYLSHQGWWFESHPYGYAAENIETAFDLHDINKTAVNAIEEFYDDPGNPNLGHRKSMLNPYFNEVGMGIVADGYGRFYIVQTFLRSTFRPEDAKGIEDYENYVQIVGERAPYISHYDKAGQAIIKR